MDVKGKKIKWMSVCGQGCIDKLVVGRKFGQRKLI